MTSAARPNHFPKTYSAREIGRARIASAIPDSSSPEIAGDATKTAASDSTQLNMNITRIRSCDTIVFFCASESGCPPFRRSSTRDTPQTVSAMTTSVSSSRARRRRRRAASFTTWRATTRTDLISLPEQAQKPLFERFVLGLDGIHARARGDDRADQLGDPLAFDAFDEDRAVGIVIELAEPGHCRARLARESGRAHTDGRGSEELGEIALCHHLAAIDDRDRITNLLDFAEQVRVEEDDRALLAERADDLAHVVAADRIERARRLVEEHDRGIVE